MIETYKRALVTGASSGFGREIALQLAQQGLEVLACGRRIEKLNELCESSKNIIPVQLDVTDKSQILSLRDKLQAQAQLPDVLINNAGLALDLTSADKACLEDWETMVDVNIKGLITLTHTFLPNLCKNNSGYIINIGSIAGNWAYPGSNTYGASKAFVAHFSKNLRADLLGKNIRVTCLEPGMAETEFSVVRFKGDSAKAKQVYTGTKPLTATDIADVISWLLSLPEHVNVNSLEVMPTCQSWGPLAVSRDS